MNYSGLKSVKKNPTIAEVLESWKRLTETVSPIRCGGMYHCHGNTFNHNNDKCMECHRQTTTYGDFYEL